MSAWPKPAPPVPSGASFSLLVPFRDADGTRTKAKDWIVARWAHVYPKLEIIVAPDDGVDPFNKSMAVNRAAAKATRDIFAICDADTWIDHKYVVHALRLLDQGVPWVVPARMSLRLRQDVSERILSMKPSAKLPPLGRRDAEVYGPVVGFLWFTTRKAFEAVGGMDERIRGWGGEDTMFTRAMDVVNGRHRRLTQGEVMSLWHTRPRDQDGSRVWQGQGRRKLEHDKEALARRYAHARTPAAMLKVLGR